MEPYTQALAGVVSQQLAARGVSLSPADLLNRLLDQETLAHHQNALFLSPTSFSYVLYERPVRPRNSPGGRRAARRPHRRGFGSGASCPRSPLGPAAREGPSIHHVRERHGEPAPLPLVRDGTEGSHRVPQSGHESAAVVSVEPQPLQAGLRSRDPRPLSPRPCSTLVHPCRVDHGAPPATKPSEVSPPPLPSLRRDGGPGREGRPR